MNLSRFFKRFLSTPEWFLPYFYPLLMPFLTLQASNVPTQSFQDSLTHYFFAGILQLLLLISIQKVLYSGFYNHVVRWGIAFLIGVVILAIYLFLEFYVFNFTSRLAYSDKWIPLPRYFLNIPIIIALVEGIKSAAERKRLVISNLMLENENAQAQLNLLLQQINPHFLFNCLSVLQSMTRSKDPRTETFVVKLAEVYQQTIKTDKGMVTLQEELDFFNAYMYLMCLRQENAIFVKTNVAIEALNLRLPVFSLQLLAENCIKHNIVSVSKPLTIHLYQKDIKSLTISNNIQPKTQKKESFGIGINNLKKRYALEGVNKGVQIENDEITYSTTIKLF